MTPSRTVLTTGAIAASAALVLSGCGSGASGAESGELSVVTSTNVYADIVSQVAGDFAEVTAAAMSHGFDVSYFSVSTMPHGLRHAAFGEAPVFDRDQAGTDMRMAFTMFDEGDWDIAVLLTDGRTPWPTTPARCREVLVAISQPEGRDVSELVDTTAAELPWATVVALPHSWKH